jgi:hypothetical protein
MSRVSCNLKEMAEMAGLCNICDEVGAQNFESLNTLLSNLKEVTSFETSTMQENNTDDNLENSCLAYNVIMVELPPHQDDKEQLNPLPKDSPVVMVETEPGVCNLALSVKGLKKSTAILDFGKYLNKYLFFRTYDKNILYYIYLTTFGENLMEFGLKFIELQCISRKACLGYPVTLKKWQRWQDCATSVM